jgi:nitronate monooxygenase
LALENGVQAIWLSFGEDLGRWIEFVRIHDQKSGKTPRTLIFVQVNSVDEALLAVQTWKVDVLVAQGKVFQLLGRGPSGLTNLPLQPLFISTLPPQPFTLGIESGGHGSASAPPVMNLIPQILSALPSSEAPPVLAAGGLSSGAHLAAFLTLGAAGAVVGTRFLVAEESQYSDVQKRAVIAANSGSAVRSYIFDQLRDTTGWPAGVDGRALAMPAVTAVESGGDMARIKDEIAEGAERGDTRSVIAWAGTGVGQLDRLQPAKVSTRSLVSQNGKS